MTRALLILANESIRQKAIDWIRKAPDGTRVKFQEKARSLDQNDRMWLILGAISKLEWFGQYYTDAEWKDYFMHALRGEKWMPLESGGMVPIGRSTSKLSKTEFSDLMALMEVFCARQNINLAWDTKPALEANKPA